MKAHGPVKTPSSSFSSTHLYTSHDHVNEQYQPVGLCRTVTIFSSSSRGCNDRSSTQVLSQLNDALPWPFGEKTEMCGGMPSGPEGSQLGRKLGTLDLEASNQAAKQRFGVSLREESGVWKQRVQLGILVPTRQESTRTHKTNTYIIIENATMPA